jgi:hypothetical protein
MTDITRPNRGPKWLSPSDAAKIVGFGRNTLERAIELGALPARKLEDGRRLVDLSDAYIFRSKLLALASVERDALEAFRREVVR